MARGNAAITHYLASGPETDLGNGMLAVRSFELVLDGALGSRGDEMTEAISYRGLPIGFVMTNQHPDFVKIQVSGPQTLLSLVDPSRLMLRLDLIGVGVGQASFKIGPDAFAVPRGTAVTSISPSQIVLDIDKVIVRYVPVHLVTTGKAADGFQ